MVSDGYLLPKRKALTCRLAGVVFLILAALVTANYVSIAAVPGLRGECWVTGCTLEVRPLMLLPEEERASVTDVRGAEAKLDAYVREPFVRAGIGAVRLLEGVPLILLLLGVALALGRLGGRGDALGRALPWLRRASLMAVIWAIAKPTAISLRTMLLFPGTPQGAYWYYEIDLIALSTALMLALAAYATVWALEAGVQAQRDLAEIV